MNPTPTLTTPTLAMIIHGLVAALLPFVDRIRADFDLPWLQRARAAARLGHILQQLLALTARLNPQKLGQACFTPARPQRTTRLTCLRAPRPPASHPAPRPPRLLSARQTAVRLAALLRELENIATDIGHALPTPIQHLSHQARTTAGCQALPPSPKTINHRNENPSPPSHPERWNLPDDGSWRTLDPGASTPGPAPAPGQAPRER